MASKNDGRPIRNIQPKINSFFTNTRVKPLKKITEKSNILSTSYIFKSLDFETAFIGNVWNTRYRKLSVIGLGLWTINLIIGFSFDSYESYAKYGFAWATVKATEWVTFCLGTYFLISKTVPWFKEGLRKLESDEHFNKSLLKTTVDVKKLHIFLLVFTITGSSIQYLILRLDKADHVTFGNQEIPYSVQVVLHLCRFVSGVHILYAYALFWCVASCVMVMTGHSMVEFQERISIQLRSKLTSPTFREAVLRFDERIKFVKNSSRSCLVLLFLLLSLSMLSIMINAYLFLYKNRYLLYIWHALMPLVLAVYPMCTAAWVTKQYHWYFVVVVKAWAEYQDDSDSDSDEETTNTNHNTIQKHKTTTNKITPTPRMRINLPNTCDHVVTDEPVAEMKPNEKWSHMLKGTIRVLGRWQRQRKIPSFNFERYISYLNHVAPTAGFKIGILTVTWEKVSTILFLLISIVAVFIQETIFGNKKSQL